MSKPLSTKELNLKFCTPALEIAFPLEEYRARLERVRRAMEAARIDLLYLTAPESRFYVSGFNSDWYQGQSPKEWHAVSGVALKADSDKFITFEKDVNEVLVRMTTVGLDARIRGGGDVRSMIDFIVGNLKDEGWAQGTVAIEKYNHRPNPAASEMLQAAFEGAGCTVVDGSDIVRALRAVKSPLELAYVKTAAEIGDIGMRAAIEKMRPGMTELDVYAEIIYAMTKAGGEHPAKTVSCASGAKTLCTDAQTSRKKIMPGEIVNIDICGCYNRYHTNYARTFSMGVPHPEVTKRITTSASAFDVLRQVIKPDVPVAEVTEAVKRYYMGAGIWEERWWVGGYDLGISFPPDWVGTFVYDPEIDPEGRRFVPGTVVNYESDFFLPQMAGLSLIIDTMMFTETGAELTQSAPHEVIVIE